MTNDEPRMPNLTFQLRSFLRTNDLFFDYRSYSFNDGQKDVFVVPGKKSKTVFTASPYVSSSIEINYYNYFMATEDLVDWIVMDSDFLISLNDSFKKLDPSSLVNIVSYVGLRNNSSNLEHDLSFDYANLMADFKKRSEIYTQEKFVLHIRTFSDDRNLKKAYDLLPPDDIEFTNVL